VPTSAPSPSISAGTRVAAWSASIGGMPASPNNSISRSVCGPWKWKIASGQGDGASVPTAIGTPAAYRRRRLRWL